MATEVKVNKNRYKLVTLLYLTSVCLSVINIPTSLLDSSLFTYKYFLKREKQENNISARLNAFITEKKDEINQVDTAVGYIKVAERINETIKYLLQIDVKLANQFKIQKKELYHEVANTGILDKVFKKDETSIQIANKLHELYKDLSKSAYTLSKDLKDEIPLGILNEGFYKIPSHSGKLVKWNYFFFEHKPAIITYTQLKRMIVVLLEEKNKYYSNALLQLNYAEEIIDIEKSRKTSQSQTDVTVEQQSDLSISVPPLVSDQQLIEPNKKATTKTNDNLLDEFIKKLLESLHPEYLFVGITNKLLSNFQYEIDKDFQIDVVPFANVTRNDNNYSIIFSKSDRYNIRFYDLRKGQKTLLFDKKVLVSLLPAPTIRLRTNLVERNGVSRTDLIIANGLTGTGNIPGLEIFPGRIVSYQVTKINSKGDRVSANNIGETFSPQTKELIKNSTSGDIVFFSNVLVNMLDGTSHTANSLAYKIN
ncbi:MAG: hypothetical protein ORN85_10260 [Sediminibacterium sp.]|nr:hypothetical protein [Sediminibacterium sp.]